MLAVLTTIKIGGAYLGWFLPGYGDGGFVCVGLVALIVFLGISARKGTRLCPHCHEANRSAAIYCAQCGRKLPDR